MSRLNLSEFSLFEKYGWIEELLGDYKALDAVLLRLDNAGAAVEALVAEFSSGDDCPRTDDLVAWFLEGSHGVDALEYFVDKSIEVESVVDELVAELGLDEDSFAADGFESYNEFCAWRNV